VKIPDPKALPGQNVLCFNNRSGQFELATVSVAEYRLPYANGRGGWWSYECLLDRRSPSGKYMHRSVGDEGIK
jgi:hypothetical protein